MMLKNNKKGLTPIIAVILLLMMTVAAAGAAFFWFIRVQGELQGGGEQFSQELNEKLTSTSEFVLGSYTNTTNNIGNLTLVLKNTGARSIPVATGSTPPTTTWLLQDEEQDIICNTNWASASDAECVSGCTSGIAVSELRTLILELSGTCDIDAYADNALFFFKIDFSGSTAVGGSFTK